LTVSRAVPYLVDPVGALLHDVTGFDKTPGGQISRIVNPPTPRQPEKKLISNIPPLPPQPRAPSVLNSAAPPQGQTVNESVVRRAAPGAGGSADTTRGLIKPGASRSLLTR